MERIVFLIEGIERAEWTKYEEKRIYILWLSITSMS